MNDDPGRSTGRRRRLRRALGAVAGAGARRLWRTSEADDRRLGEALVAELDQMKGMAMKVGQILSYLDGLPEGTQEILGRLQQGVSPMSPEAVAAAVTAGLGRPPEALFDQFDPVPVAAASIGQVHRASLGQDRLAVKVQYPEVVDTLEGDMAQLRRLARVASLATHVDGLALVAELRERIVEECDYLREADHQRRFADAFAGDVVVVVPDVIPDRSCRTVLTTRWHDGAVFARFREAAEGPQRQRAARALIRVAWRSVLVHRALNADPHPGNYLFADDHVVFLDYGCVRHFDAGFAEAHRDLVRIALDGDRRAFPAALEALGMVGRVRGFDYDLQWEHLLYEFEPYRTPHFRFTSEYTARAMKYSGPKNPNLRKVSIPPPMIWLMRMQYGLHAVLARLGAEGDFRGLLRDALDAEVTPL